MTCIWCLTKNQLVGVLSLMKNHPSIRQSCSVSTERYGLAKNTSKAVTAKSGIHKKQMNKNVQRFLV